MEQQPPPTDAAVPVRRPPPPELLGPGVLIPAYVLLVVVGYALFARGWCTRVGNEPSRPLALMTAVNAATLTGFQQARTPADFTPFGQVVTLVLIVGGTLFSLIGGGLAVVRIARLSYQDRTVATWAAAAVGCAAIVGVALTDPGRPSVAAVYLAVSAFGNCGLYLGQLPVGGDPRTAIVLLPLAILGGLGLPVLMDLGRLRASPHTRRVLAASAVVYLLTVAVLVPMLAWRATVAETRAAVPAAVATASRVAINARSAGFPFEFVGELPAAAAVVLIVVMVVGGGPGGTAGGVKVTTVAAVAGGAWAAVRGRPAGRAFGLAVAVLLGYVGLILAAWSAFLLADPEVRPDRALFLAASALGNVGLSHERVSASHGGMITLAVTMLLGRVLPVVLLWTIADRAADVTDAIG